MDFCIVVELFDHAAAIAERASLPVVSAHPALLSLDTPTGLPPELDREISGLRGSHIPRDIFTLEDRPPPSLTRPLASTAPPPPGAIAPVFAPLRPLDWRFGHISIDWADMPPPPSPLPSSSPKPSTSRAHSTVGSRGTTERSPLSSTIKLDGADSGTVDLGFGLIHLYRAEDSATLHEDGAEIILGVLAIPPLMGISDFLLFVEPAEESISQIRILRDALPNRCMALLKFRNADDADLFVEEYNAKPFWAMLDDEICHVVRVRSIEIKVTTVPPFTLFPTATAAAPSAALAGATALTELPTCPVCLERMDVNVTGLITIVCQHTFHCHCLSKWASGKCPVCRYSQTRPRAGSTLSSEAAASSLRTRCDDCGAESNLWMCLLCGHVGCDRYGGRHAVTHYEHSVHLYAMELETQRVWDYAGDAYVHRLIQDKTDGKLVELPSRGSTHADSPERSTGGGPNRAASLNQEKIEAIGSEYSHLLTTQLDSQRQYYVEKVAELKGELAEADARHVVSHEHVERLGVERAILEAKVTAIERQRLPALEQDNARLAQKTERATALARVLQHELASEREISAALVANLKAAQDKGKANESAVAALMEQIGELQEQVRDLMFALTARDKIEGDGSGEVSELAGGDVIVPPPPPPPSRRKRR